MSVEVYYQGQKENPTTAVFFVEISDVAARNSLMGPFSKASITPRSALRSHSPLAEALFTQTRAFLARVDVHADDNRIYISTVCNPLASWDQNNIGKMGNFLATYFNDANNPPELVKASAKTENVPVLIAMEEPDDPIGKKIVALIRDTFQEEVLPVLQRDGGSMELLSFDVNDKGQIFVDVALFGSCGGCKKSTESTLKDATGLMQKALTWYQEDFPKPGPGANEENRDCYQMVQSLSFGGFTPVKTQDGMLVLKQPSQAPII